MISLLGISKPLYPKERAWEIFASCDPVTDDFCESILKARQVDTQAPREGYDALYPDEHV